MTFFQEYFSFSGFFKMNFNELRTAQRFEAQDSVLEDEVSAWEPHIEWNDFQDGITYIKKITVLLSDERSGNIFIQQPWHQTPFESSNRVDSVITTNLLLFAFTVYIVINNISSLICLLTSSYFYLSTPILVNSFLSNNQNIFYGLQYVFQLDIWWDTKAIENSLLTKCHANMCSLIKSWTVFIDINEWFKRGWQFPSSEVFKASLTDYRCVSTRDEYFYASRVSIPLITDF